MKLNLASELKDLAGLTIPDGDSGKKVTIKAIILNALMGTYEDEKSLSGEDKLKRYTLGQEIQKAETIELTAEQISTIKSLVGKAYTTLVVGSSYQILEGN